MFARRVGGAEGRDAVVVGASATACTEETNKHLAMSVETATGVARPAAHRATPEEEEVVASSAHLQKRPHELLERGLLERAQQLFLLTDQERKGFIIKRDMQRMRSEIAMAPEELEDVFDSLDVKGNGVLTLEQFLGGFDRFLNSRSRNGATVRTCDDAEDLFSGEDSGISLQTQDGDEEQLQELLHQLTAAGLHGDEALRRLWRHARDDGGARLQADLETFLQQLTRELWRRQRDYQQLEMTLDRHKHDHKQEVQRLFEEMEAQLAEDREKILQKGEEKLRLSKKILEDELANKTKLLHKTWEDHNCLTEQIQALQSSESLIKQENAQLLRSKEEIDLRLAQQCRELIQLRHTLQELRQNEVVEKKKHLNQGFRLARSIMLEQQGLLQQLELVRGMVATLDDDIGHKVWRSPEERSRIQDASLNSFETASGVLDDYEYDEDYCHTMFQKAELLRSLGTQTIPYTSGTSSLQEELESFKSNDCDFTSARKVL